MSKEKKLDIKAGKSSMFLEEDGMFSLGLPSESFECDVFILEARNVRLKQVIDVNNINGKIHFHSYAKSNLDIQLGILCSLDNVLEIRNTLDSEAVSNINIHLLPKDRGNSVVKTTGIINKDTVNTYFKEEIKVLNDSEQKIVCIPDLIVNSDDSVAIHNVTIKNITEEEIFYLKSKGILEDNAKELIKEGFLGR